MEKKAKIFIRIFTFSTGLHGLEGPQSFHRPQSDLCHSGPGPEWKDNLLKSMNRLTDLIFGQPTRPNIYRRSRDL